MPSAADRLAVAAGQRFLTDFIDPDGRVVRRDQGGDTVSEGQGYALLIAVAVGDERAFARVWTWTQRNLQRPDGQLGYLWNSGRLTDATPAADADTQVAWALTLAGRKFHDPAFTSAGRRLALVAVAADTAYTDHGGAVLAAGPWAVGHGPDGQSSGPATSATVEPGYWSFPVEQALGAITGDARYLGMISTQERLLASLTAGGSRLPPDWAHVGGGNEGHPSSAPDGSAMIQSAQDGQRALVWAALDPRTRALDAHWWALISATASAAPVSRQLSGAVAQADRSPLGAVAAAAAALSAGNAGAATGLLGESDQIAVRFPTYYGAAWDALGRLLLTTDRLGASV